MKKAAKALLVMAGMFIAGMAGVIAFSARRVRKASEAMEG